jgi:inhibitor of cysteine peptidase
MKKFFLLAVTSVFLLSCATFAFTPTPTAPLLPTGETPNPLPEPTDPTQLIVVSPNQTFEIVMPSNPSTGYRWNLVNEVDANVLVLVEQSYIAEQPVLAGSGGVEVWTFSAVAPGETTLDLGYSSPSGDAQPEEILTFSIRVE